MRTVVALEIAEIEAAVDLYRAASAPVTECAGRSLQHMDRTLAVMGACRLDVLALNRVVGLGLRSPASDVTVDAALDALAATGCPRGFVQVAPTPGHDALEAALAARGLRHYNNWMRLQRDLSDLAELPVPPSSLEIRPIGREHAEAFGRIVSTGFGFPSSLAPFPADPIGRSGWHHYLAFEGETAVAAAAMFIAGPAAWFGFMATDVAHRRKGAQQALVVRRLRDAAAAGCRWVSVETAEDTKERDAPSFRNLRRLGFTVAYRRPNYLWTRP